MIKASNVAAVRTAQEVKARAVLQSSGTMTAADRRRADYPFAKRHGLPLWDPSTINVGRGVFQKGWTVSFTFSSSGVNLYRAANGRAVPVVTNQSDVAGYLEQGTPKMFARPLKQILEETAQASWNRIAPSLFEAALRNALPR